MDYSNPISLTNKAEIHISVGSNADTYAYENNRPDNTDLNVGSDCIFEALSENKAFSNIKASDDTKNLGAYVNENASNDRATYWDKNTDLSTYKFVYIPGTLSYTFVSGDGQNWYKGSSSGAPFTVKGKVNDSWTYRNFTGISVDGTAVDEKDYDKQEGSVIITLKSSYLETLSVGPHELKAEFEVFENTYAEVSAGFTIVEKSSGGNSDSSTPVYRLPKTGIE